MKGWSKVDIPRPSTSSNQCHSGRISMTRPSLLATWVAHQICFPRSSTLKPHHRGNSDEGESPESISYGLRVELTENQTQVIDTVFHWIQTPVNSITLRSCMWILATGTVTSKRGWRKTGEAQTWFQFNSHKKTVKWTTFYRQENII